MSNLLPPIPNDKLEEKHIWREWLTSLREKVNIEGTGVTGTITTASLVGKTITIKDGIITEIL
jgi:hypothetical protein